MHRTAGSVAALLAASFVFVSGLGAWAAAASLDLGSYDWSVNAKPNLVSKPPPQQAIRAFLAKLYANDPDVGEPPSAIGRFAFADLRQSGTLSLVAPLAPGGPGGCGNTLIVDKVGEKFESALIDCTGSPSEISGKPVVVSDIYITPYQGTRSIFALFPVIYGWNGSAYVDMSGNFPGYYRKVLQDLQHEIASPPANLLSPYQWRHLNLDSASSPIGRDKIEAGAIARFLGSPDAGIEDAIHWSQSSNEIDRMEAIDLFGNIGTPRALEYLKAMTGNSDPGVARAAEGTLNALNSGAPDVQDPVAKVGHFKVYVGPHS